MTLLLWIQVLHILSGTIWLCSFIFMYFFLWPALIKSNSIEALVFNKVIKKSAGNVLAVAGTVSISLGLIRGFFWSGMDHWSSFFTPYGRYYAGAILLSILMILVGKKYGSNLVEIARKDTACKNRSLVKLYLTGSFILLCYTILLFCMVKMRFGG
jgi:uncharacterized membrane protein